MDIQKSENYISKRTVIIIALFTFMAFALGCSEFVLIVFGCLTFVSNLLAGVVDMKWGMKSLIPVYAGGVLCLAAAIIVIINIKIKE